MMMPDTITLDDGSVLERVQTFSSDDGGPPLGRYLIRGPEATLGTPQSVGLGLTHGGRVIVQEIAPIAPSRRVEAMVEAAHPGVTTLTGLDRGLLRSAVEAIIATQEAEGKATSAMRAQALQEVIEATPGDRIPVAGFRESPFASAIMPLISPLLPNAYGPADAKFPLGECQFGLSSPPLLTHREIEDYIDRHAREPGGDAWGPAVEPGAVAAFCPALSSAAESNHVALATRNGPVFSRFNIDPTPTSNGHRVKLDVLTITSPSGPSRTTAWAGIISQGLLA